MDIYTALNKFLLPKALWLIHDDEPTLALFTSPTEEPFHQPLNATPCAIPK